MAWYNFWKKEKRNLEEDINTGCGYLGLSNWLGKYNQPIFSLSAVFAAVELISNAVAELPLNVKTMQDDKTTIVKNHPLYNVFEHSLLSKYTLLKQMVSDMLLYGNGFALIERAADGTPINIVYCPHGTVSIQYNQQTMELYYLVPSLRRGRVEPIDMIHILKNSKDGINGEGIIKFASRTIDLAIATEKAAQDYFSSGCHVAGILSTNNPRLTPEQRDAIRNSWQQAHGRNGTGIAVLENGMQYQSVSNNSKESQLLESRLFNVQDIARFFNINPVLLGDLSHSSYSTIEASLLEFVTHTLYPYITLIEEELKRKLIKPSERGLYIDLDVEFIEKSDKQSQANYLSTLKNAGIITINEAREKLGLNKIEGGDVLMVNYTNIKDNIIGEQNKKEEEEQ